MADEGSGAAMSSATVAKMASMAILGVVPLVLGVLPWVAMRAVGRKNGGGDRAFESPAGRLGTSILLCFGGGVLLCTTFFHMQPEVRESVVELQSQGRLPPGSGLAEIFIFCGFFFVYLVEELAHAWMHGGRGGATEDAVHRTVGARRCSAVSQRTEAGCCEDKDVFRSSAELVLGAPIERHAEHHSHVHVMLEGNGSLTSSLPGLLVVLALSFHAVFEGLAVGLEASASSVWVLCGAVAAHKFVIAFCVGVELAAARTRPALLALYVSTFALVTPLGIGIGTAVSEASAAAAESSVTVVALQGMASGTILYVVFFEVLQRGKKDDDDEEELLGRLSGLAHLCAVLIGFLAMYGLLFLGEPLENTS